MYGDFLSRNLLSGGNKDCRLALYRLWGRRTTSADGTYCSVIYASNEAWHRWPDRPDHEVSVGPGHRVLADGRHSLQLSCCDVDGTE